MFVVAGAENANAVFYIAGTPAVPNAYTGGGAYLTLDPSPGAAWMSLPIPNSVAAFWASFSVGGAGPGPNPIPGPTTDACPSSGMTLRAHAAPKKARAGRTTVRLRATMTFKPSNKSVTAFGNAGLTVALPAGVQYVKSRVSPSNAGVSVVSGSTVIFPDQPLKAGKTRRYWVSAKVLAGTPAGVVLPFGVRMTNCAISAPNATVRSCAQKHMQ